MSASTGDEKVMRTIVPEPSARFVSVGGCTGGTQSIVLLHRNLGGGGNCRLAEPGPSEQLHAKLHQPSRLVSDTRCSRLCQHCPSGDVALRQLVDFEGLCPRTCALICPSSGRCRQRACPGGPQERKRTRRSRRTANAYPLHVSLSTLAQQAAGNGSYACGHCDRHRGWDEKSSTHHQKISPIINVGSPNGRKVPSHAITLEQ
jgi:hypothetical protein